MNASAPAALSVKCAPSAPPAVPAGIDHVRSAAAWSSSVAANGPTAVCPSATSNADPLPIAGVASSSMIVAVAVSVVTPSANAASTGSLSVTVKVSFSSST